MSRDRPTAVSVSIAVAVFRRLTSLLPNQYARRHGEDVVGLLAQLAADAHRSRGALGVLAVAAAAIVDLMLRLPREHFRGSRRRNPQPDTPWRVPALAPRDLRYALRSLLGRPLSSTAVIATLAIGIGLNAAMFAVFDWVLLRPLPYPSPQHLVRVWSAGTAPLTRPADLTYSEFVAFSRSRAFRAVTAFSMATRVIGGQGLEPAHVVVARVAGDLLGTLGVPPEIGRGIEREEAAAGAAIVVVSHGLWRSRLAMDPAVVGRVLTIDGEPHTVVGVMPAGRGYPKQAELWRPLTTAEREDDDRENVMIARLAGDASAELASAELATLAGAVPGPARKAWVEELQRTEVHDVRAALTMLLASSALILLMASSNVAALIGARGADRAGEMAVRAALGASRARLLGQLLTESALLAAAGGAGGLLLGRWALDVLIALAPPGLPRLSEIALDGRVLLVGIGATLVVALVVGLAPAWQASRLDLRATLGGAAGGRTSAPTFSRRMLVGFQAAMAVVLSIGAGLLGRSLQHLVSIDHGFAVDRLLVVDLYLRGGVGGDVRQLYRELVDGAEAIPGVLSAAVSLRLPTDVPGLRVSLRGERGPTLLRATAILRPVTPRYFETTGIRLLGGRAFDAGDGRTAALVGIVNAAFVHDVLGDGQALGATLRGDLFPGALSIVGVAANVTPAGEPDRPALYVPQDQLAIAGGVLLVRTEGDPRSVVPALASRLRAVAPGLARDRIHSVAEVLEAGRAVTRFSSLLAAVFAGLAMLLAAIGVYALTAGEVAARSRETALRIALGATRREALWTVMRPGTAALAGGAALGMAAALGLGRWIASLLHGIGPADPATLVAVPLLLASVGLGAAALAAARVLRADAALALRRE